MGRDLKDHSGNSKKTDHIQIRVPPETKKEFLAACEEDKVSASDVLRRAILDYLAARKKMAVDAVDSVVKLVPRPMRKRRYLAAAAAVVGLAVVTALPSAAAPDFTGTFQRLDLNHDGMLTEEEFTLRGEKAGQYAKPVVQMYGMEVYDTPLGPVSRSQVKPGQIQNEKVARMFTIAPGAGMHMIARMDRSGVEPDSKVSTDEFELALRRSVASIFRNGDSNQDGKLDARELDVQFAPRPLPAGTRPNPRMEEQTRLMLKISRAEYQAYDADGDGLITLDEALEGRLAAMVAAYASPN